MVAGEGVNKAIGSASRFISLIADIISWFTGTLQGRFILLILVVGLIVWLYYEAMKEEHRYAQFKRRM